MRFYEFYLIPFCYGIVFIFLVFPQMVNAQKLTILDGTTIFFKENTIFTSESDIILKGKFSANRSTIHLHGNWEGKGSLDFSENTLVVQGEGAQTIDVNLESIFNLHSKAEGLKLFNQALTVENQLWLEKGLIKFSGNHVLKLRGSIKGGSSQSYVVNKLERKGGKDESEFLFPIGEETKYLPIHLLNLQASEDFEIRMEVIPESPEILLDNSELLEHVSTVRYWEKTQISPANIIIGNISMKFNEDESPITPNNAVILGGEGKGVFFDILGRKESSTSEMISSQIPITAIHHLFSFGAEKNFEDLDCIPNAFASSSESSEDQVFKVLCPGISKKDFNISIFDKWGINVWNSNDLDMITTTGWAGVNADGNELVPGAYEFLLRGKMTSGKDFIRQGVIFKLD